MKIVCPDFTPGQDMLLVSLFLTCLCSALMSCNFCSCMRGRGVEKRQCVGPEGHQDVPLYFCQDWGLLGLGSFPFVLTPRETTYSLTSKKTNKQNVRN